MLCLAAITCALFSASDADDMMMPMPDGVGLHTKIWKPGGGAYPVVFTRAYRPGFGRDNERFTDAGYVYVGQSTRGHAQSEGVMNRFFDDASDGYDALTWIAAQPWCNGDIAMYGKSYWAATQWLVAPEQHPNLRAIIPQNVNADFWERGYRDHGAIQLAHTARRIYDDGGQDKIEAFGWLDWYRHLPLIDLDTVAGTPPNKMWREYVSHSTYDEYWRAISIGDRYDRIRTPTYLMCGWYDNYPGATLKSYRKLSAVGATDEVRVVISPSDHLNRIVGDRDFGPDAGKDEIGLAIRWLDHVVKGIDTGLDDEPPVRIFVMGVNEWRHEAEWPLARTRYTDYYLVPHADGGGSLSTQSPGESSSVTYTYDPDDPTPTLGGNHSSPDIPGILRVGTVDQRLNEDRDDVLVYSTPPLDEDTEVTGPVVVRLHAASTAVDTDFFARLIDVYPDGTAYNLTEGLVRARFRESIWGTPSPIEPGRVYEYVIEMQPTSNVFLRGHRIRLHITSSNFPFIDRNTNMGGDIGFEDRVAVAEQTVWHSGTRPSRVVLPVIP